MNLEFEWDNQKASLNLNKHSISFENEEIMKNSQASEFCNNADDDLLPEYSFDYRKALPNRFPSQQEKAPLTVTLDADVAEIFKTSEAVNNALRALLSAIPKTER